MYCSCSKSLPWATLGVILLCVRIWDQEHLVLVIKKLLGAFHNSLQHLIPWCPQIAPDLSNVSESAKQSIFPSR